MEPLLLRRKTKLFFLSKLRFLCRNPPQHNEFIFAVYKRYFLSKLTSFHTKMAPDDIIDQMPFCYFIYYSANLYCSYNCSIILLKLLMPFFRSTVCTSFRFRKGTDHSDILSWSRESSVLSVQNHLCLFLLLWQPLHALPSAPL